MGTFGSSRIRERGHAAFNGGVRAIAMAVVAVAIAGVWPSGAVVAQGTVRNAPKFYPDSSDEAERQLRNGSNHARENQWSEAIDIFQKVIDRFGDKVARLPKGEPGTDPEGGFVLYLDGRHFSHRSIAQLPPEARQVYRNRVDVLAERWYREGAARRDLGLLRRVVDQAFCSSWGDDALDLLGDLSFQDGRFVEALSMYGQLVPDRVDDPSVLVHPDPSVDLARVAAKKLLCRAALRDPPGEADLREFARRYAGASGELAGRTGSYATILARALESDHLEAPGLADGRWPTFAGSPRRTRVVPGPIDVGQVQWRVEIEKVTTSRIATGFSRGIPSASSSSRAEDVLAFHPIVMGDQVMICDGSRVLAYNLGDRPAGSEGGESRPVTPAWKHDPENGAGIPQASRPYGAVPRYTLTAQGHRIFARMGTSSTFYPGRRGLPMTEAGTSSIVALDWNTQGKLLWEKRSANLELPNRPAGARTQTINFEGTPVADSRSVYAGVTDRGTQTMIYIACFDAETGATRWIRYLGAASPEFPDQMGGFGAPMIFSTAPGDFHHRLITLDGPTLYYLTNLGAVVALDAETGATRWVATYPRQEGNRFSGGGSDRDLNPAVVHEGRVIVAPSDADSVFAFDAASGRLLWKTEPIAQDVKLSHVLGVAKGRLVVTGNRVLLFDVKDGKLAGAWPDSTSKSMEGYGRGLLAGDLIYWPTRNDIQVLNQRTGLRTEPPIKLQETFRTTGGNLAAGDGYLIVAQADGLVAFCQNSRLIERYRGEIVLAPERASNYYRLARAAEAIGRDEMALAAYRQAIGKARANESIDGVPLAGAARDHLFRMLMRMAARSRREAGWDRAIEQLGTAAGFAGNDAERLESRLLLADILLDARRPREAVEALERVLTDTRLRPLPVAEDDGRRTVRADLMVADRLGTIVRRHGREVYEAFDRQAAALFERGKKERDAHVLDEVCRDFPVARIVPDALLELGRLHESSGRLAEAAHAYKRLLAAAPDDDRRARAIWSLARIYDARKLYVSARDAYLDLAARYPRIRLEPDGSTVADRVSERLAREPYARLGADRPRPAIAPPLARRWHRPSPSDRTVRAVSAEGVVPSLDASRIILGDGDALRLLDGSDGSARWSAELASPAVWACYLQDKLIAAGPEQVIAVDLAVGTVRWRYKLGGAGRDADHADPFAADDDPADDHAERSGRRLHGFRLVKGRIFCLRGPADLIAIDGDTGAVDWSFSAPPGHIRPDFWVGADRIVLQVDRPNHLLILRTEDGQPVARTPLTDGDVLEQPPVPVDDDSVLVVLDPRTVKRLDLTHGQILWEYRESEILPVNGAPRLLGDGERALVLHDGRTLIRLDPATGSKRWSCPLGLEDLSNRRSAMAFDDRRFYCISRFASTVTLRAISLADGTPCWESRWTGDDDSSWSIAMAADYVVAYPNRATQGDVGGTESIPVVVRRRDSGTLVQRLVFPAGSGADAAGGGRAGAESVRAVTFRLDPLGAVVATPRGIWKLASGPSGVAAATAREPSR